MISSQLKIWFITARPKTLPLALASIVTGSALADYQHTFSWSVCILSFLTALFLQVLSNFANDYGDYLKGSDTAERIGPLRAIQHGQINGTQLKRALIIMICVCLVSGLTLIVTACRNWQDLLSFALLGILAIIASITYTVGRKPYGYIGLGDISVLIFFGWLGIGGTFYLQAHYINFPVLFAATAGGLLATAVLNINNLRDIEQDRQAGKNTLAVRLGSHTAKIYHCLLLGLAMFLYLVFAFIYLHHWNDYLFLLAFPFLIKHALDVLHVDDPLQLRPMLAQMAMLALITNLLFSFGLII